MELSSFKLVIENYLWKAISKQLPLPSKTSLEDLHNWHYIYFSKYITNNKSHKYDGKLFTSEVTCHLCLWLLPCQDSILVFFFFLTAICIEPGVIELLVKVLGCTARYISNIKRTYTNKGMQTKNYINAKENWKYIADLSVCGNSIREGQKRKLVIAIYF